MNTNSDTGDGTKVVYTFTKNAFQEVWAYRQPFRGNDLAHVRVYTVGSDGTTMQPTKQGLAINVRLLPELANAVTALQETVGKRGRQ